MIEKLGGRKFILTVIASILFFVLVLVNKMTPVEFLNFMTGNIAIYGTANVISKFADKGK